jgi:Virulence factor BrkB
VRRIVAPFDRWQRRHVVGGFAVAVVKKFSEDRASSLGALVAFYAFFSLFPLLLAFVSILGFVLEDNPTLRDDVLDTALAQIPVIGPQLADEVEPLTGSGPALAIGLLGALWAALGVTLALGRAFAEIWDVPRLNQPNGIMARLRGLAVFVVLAVTLVAATAVAGLAAGGGMDAASTRLVAELTSLAANAVAFLAVFALPPLARGRSASCCPASLSRLWVRSCYRRWAAGTWIARSAVRAQPTARSRSSSACSRGSGSAPSCCSWPPRSTSCGTGACGRGRWPASSSPRTGQPWGARSTLRVPTGGNGSRSTSTSPPLQRWDRTRR